MRSIHLFKFTAHIKARQQHTQHTMPCQRGRGGWGWRVAASGVFSTRLAHPEHVSHVIRLSHCQVLRSSIRPLCSADWIVRFAGAAAAAVVWHQVRSQRHWHTHTRTHTHTKWHPHRNTAWPFYLLTDNILFYLDTLKTGKSSYLLTPYSSLRIHRVFYNQSTPLSLNFPLSFLFAWKGWQRVASQGSVLAVIWVRREKDKGPRGHAPFVGTFSKYLCPNTVGQTYK